MGTKNREPLSAADWHERFMVVLSGIVLVTYSADVLITVITNGADAGAVRTRAWVYLALAIMAFYFFTSQHIKMRKYRIANKSALRLSAHRESVEGLGKKNGE